MGGLHAVAMECFLETLPAFEAASKPFQAEHALLLRHMGTCCGHRGLSREAMSYFVKSQAAFEAAGDTWRKTPEYASLLCDAGMCCYNEGRAAEAMAFFSK